MIYTQERIKSNLFNKPRAKIILNFEDCKVSSDTGNKAKMQAFHSLLSTVLKVLPRAMRKEKRHPHVKGKGRTTSIQKPEDIILYQELPQKSTKIIGVSHLIQESYTAKILMHKYLTYLYTLTMNLMKKNLRKQFHFR